MSNPPQNIRDYILQNPNPRKDCDDILSQMNDDQKKDLEKKQLKLHCLINSMSHYCLEVINREQIQYNRKIQREYFLTDPIVIFKDFKANFYQYQSFTSNFINMRHDNYHRNIGNILNNYNMYFNTAKEFINKYIHDKARREKALKNLEEIYFGYYL